MVEFNRIENLNLKFEILELEEKALDCCQRRSKKVTRWALGELKTSSLMLHFIYCRTWRTRRCDVDVIHSCRNYWMDNWKVYARLMIKMYILVFIDLIPNGILAFCLPWGPPHAASSLLSARWRHTAESTIHSRSRMPTAPLFCTCTQRSPESI